MQPSSGIYDFSFGFSRSRRSAAGGSTSRSPHSEKDRKAWQLVESRGHVDVLGQNGLRTFDGCFAKTLLVRFSLSRKLLPQSHSRYDTPPRRVGGRLISVSVVRGRVQMSAMVPAAQGEGLPFVHSTELHADSLELVKRRAANLANCVQGPAVLIHRVGQPSKRKVALYLCSAPIVLSDCVIALRTKTARQARMLRGRILRSWAIWEANYGGTCAPYITIERVLKLLLMIGCCCDDVDPLRPGETACVSRRQSARGAV